MFYTKGNEDQAQELLKILEHYRRSVENLTGNRIRKLPVVIEDIGDLSNGFANPVFKSIHLFTYPPSEGELQFMQNWWGLVGVHEYTHMLHLRTSSGFPAVLAAIFGPALCPNLLSPLWMMEGIAVYSESRISEYSGRLNDGTFDAYLGALVQEARLPSLVEATYLPLSYNSGWGPYLFGGKFLGYLSLTYGEEKFSQFFNKYGASLLSYFSPLVPAVGLDRTAKQIFGKSFPDLWKDWQIFEGERFKDYRQEGEPLTAHGWEVKNPIYFEGRLFFSRAYAVKIGPFKERRHYELVELDLSTGRERVRVSSTSPFTSPLKIRGNKLYYTTLQIQGGYDNIYYNSFGFLSILNELDLNSGKRRKIFKDHIRAYTVLDEGDILFARDRPDRFGSMLCRLMRHTEETELLFTLDVQVGEITADDQGFYLSARRDWQNFSLYRLDFQGKLTPLIETPYLERGILLYGNRLIFQANYEGVYSIYCYDLELKQLFRVTHGGYAASPAYDRESGLIYFVGLNAEGRDIYYETADFRETEFPDYMLPTAPHLSLSEGKIRRGGYWDNIKTLFPKLLFPIFTADTSLENIGAGMGVMGMTALQDFQYVLKGWYNFGYEQPEVDLFLETLILSPLITSFNFSTIEWNSLEAILEIPLYQSLSSGLSLFSVGISGEIFKDDFSRKKIEPFMGLAFRYPLSHASLWFGLLFERKELGSSMDRTGLIANTLFSRYLFFGEAKVFILGLYDLDRANWILPRIRGYSERLEAQAGAVLSFDYSIPLFKIRKGLWNPGIFIEDLFLNPFVDCAFNDRMDYQLSGGVEIHLEIKALVFISGLPLDAAFRIAVNRRGEPSIAFTLMSPLLDKLPYRKYGKEVME